MGTSAIRPATETDITALQQLLTLPGVGPSVFGRLVSREEVCVSVEGEMAFSRQGYGRTFVCGGTGADGEPRALAGYAAHIGGELSFAVHPACRRRGYGRALIGHAARHAFGQGTDMLTAEVVRENLSSARLLESLGFCLVGILSHRRHRPGAIVLRYRLYR